MIVDGFRMSSVTFCRSFVRSRLFIHLLSHSCALFRLNSGSDDNDPGRDDAESGKDEKRDESVDS